MQAGEKIEKRFEEKGSGVKCMKKREGRVSLKRKQSLAGHGKRFGFHLKYKRNHRRISSGVENMWYK